MRGQEGRPVDGERKTENKGEGEGGGVQTVKERANFALACSFM